MKKSIRETEKRLSIAKEFNEKVKKSTLGIILIGSVAYAPNHAVTEASDLDLIVVYEDIKDCIDLYFKDEKEKDHLRNANYGGFLVKRKMSGVAVSIHNISARALEKISTADYKDLLYYRQGAKDITYYSKDFSGNNHPFRVKSVPVQGLIGVKRVDPVAFCRNGNFVMGNDIDKLLSNAIIMHDTNERIASNIETLWKNIAERMIEHFSKLDNISGMKYANISKFLCRSERFSRGVNKKLNRKMQKTIRKIQKHDKQ